MQKNTLLFLILFFVSSLSFSQTTSLKKTTSSKVTGFSTIGKTKNTSNVATLKPLARNSVEEVSKKKLSLYSESSNIATRENSSVEKNKLPKNQKVSPEIFYVKGDKPVSREEYMKQFHK
jgi:hypothetical protein